MWLISLVVFGCGGALQTTLAPLDVPPSCGGVATLAEVEAAHEAHPELACLLHRARRTPALAGTAALARLCALLADTQPGARGEQLAAEGVRAAEAALAGNPADGPAHYYLAVNLGIAVQDQVALALKSLKTLENHLQRAVELAPATDDGGPLRVAGLFYLRTPAWPDGPGDGDRALELLARAVAEHPGHPLNHLAHAQALWEVESDGAAATRALDAAEAALTPDRGPVGQRWRREIEALRTEL